MCFYYHCSENISKLKGGMKAAGIFRIYWNLNMNVVYVAVWKLFFTLNTYSLVRCFEWTKCLKQRNIVLITLVLKAFLLILQEYKWVILDIGLYLYMSAGSIIFVKLFMFSHIFVFLLRQRSIEGIVSIGWIALLRFSGSLLYDNEIKTLKSNLEQRFIKKLNMQRYFYHFLSVMKTAWLYISIVLPIFTKNKMKPILLTFRLIYGLKVFSNSD